MVSSDVVVPLVMMLLLQVNVNDRCTLVLVAEMLRLVLLSLSVRPHFNVLPCVIYYSLVKWSLYIL